MSTKSKLHPWNWLSKETSRDRPLTQRRPSHPLLRWDREFDNWFEQMLGDMAWTTPAPHAEPSAPFRPSIDIVEKPDRYVITLEVPGLRRDDLSVELDGDALVITGRKEETRLNDEDGYHYSERRFGRFQRLLTLPADADGDALSAAFDNGLLTLDVPRHENHPRSTRTIDIR
ncbi:Hsp20/alpha crystallin family protein [Alloalcanivorax gelatiniphagus]|uniref:Hsp20/alpha crystallin family protein n=1 Tax=Alloalcanivorax gelatiniphagus TaxID=1194167 RepID=A0ABY2XLU9_9GAMM|nr:Hsp20/alpha crystallin family protein [Alloalcanivorax gelatiniphagus]TMW12780.1 Hsp20/alpha crystallin family protein [Alloalcanivorax gelatiniphagus]